MLAGASLSRKQRRLAEKLAAETSREQRRLPKELTENAQEMPIEHDGPSRRADTLQEERLGGVLVLFEDDLHKDQCAQMLRTTAARADRGCLLGGVGSGEVLSQFSEGLAARIMASPAQIISTTCTRHRE